MLVRLGGTKLDIIKLGGGSPQSLAGLRGTGLLQVSNTGLLLQFVCSSCQLLTPFQIKHFSLLLASNKHKYVNLVESLFSPIIYKLYFSSVCFYHLREADNWVKCRPYRLI